MKVYILWHEFWLKPYSGENVGAFMSKQAAVNFVKKHNGSLAEEFDDPDDLPNEYYIIEELPVLES